MHFYINGILLIVKKIIIKMKLLIYIILSRQDIIILQKKKMFTALVHQHWGCKNPMVLKTRPDQLVQLIKLKTGPKFGSVLSKNRKYQKIQKKSEIVG